MEKEYNKNNYSADGLAPHEFFWILIGLAFIILTIVVATILDSGVALGIMISIGLIGAAIILKISYKFKFIGN